MKKKLLGIVLVLSTLSLYGISEQECQSLSSVASNFKTLVDNVHAVAADVSAVKGYFAQIPSVLKGWNASGKVTVPYTPWSGLAWNINQLLKKYGVNYQLSVYPALTDLTIDSSALAQLADNIGQAVTGDLNPLVTFLNNNGVSASAQNIGTAIQQFAHTLADQLAECGTSSIPQALKNELQTNAATISNSVSAAVNAGQDLATGNLSGLVNNAGTVVNNLKDSAAAVANTAKSVVSTAASTAENAAKQVGSTVENTGKSIWHHISNPSSWF